MNLRVAGTRQVGEPYQTINASAAADGIVGGVLPDAIFYLPMQASNRPVTALSRPNARACP